MHFPADFHDVLPVEAMSTPPENIDLIDYFSKIAVLIKKKTCNLAAFHAPLFFR
jgi:hypothetical protein